jgi:glycosyltransferase involved in cell wall biosynthesis
MVGDFACPTGFATVMHNIAKHLRKNWEIEVLAINYHGDPHPLQKSFRIYPAALEGDVYGVNRFPKFVTSNQYDLIFILNDIWIIDAYLDSIKRIPKDKRPPIVFYTPVDAKHLKKSFVAPLNQCDQAIFYTEFGKNEALEGGLQIPVEVIPHGVDMQVFHFMPQKIARKETGVPEDWYVTLMCNRN